MATSVFMGNSCSDVDQNTRREMEMKGSDDQKPNRIHQTGKPGGGGGGRRKSKVSESGQKKKQPQRGMGVEQLERLRYQERLKKLKEISPLSYQQNHHFTTFQTPFVGYTTTNGHEPPLLVQGFHGPLAVGPNLFSDDRLLADPFCFRTTGNGIEAASKELTSIPNNFKWNSDQHCGVCNKRFRSNGENINCNGERKMCGEMFSSVNGYNSNFAVGNKGYNLFNGGGNAYYGSKPTGHEEVEVMAVHRKGNSGGGGGSLLMEYEFFPGKVGTGNNNYKQPMSLTSSAKPEATMTYTSDEGLKVDEEGSDEYHHFHGGVMERFSNTNSIDLSLKLSNY